MRPHWTWDSGDAGRYLGRARYILAAVVIVALIVLPFVLVRAFQVDALLSITRLEVTDDQTWVTSQLEVDFLKFAVSVEQARSNSEKSVVQVSQLEVWPELQKRFDIFYSRLGTVSRKIEDWSDASGAWHRSRNLLDELFVHRSRIAAILDEARDPEGLLDLSALSAAVTAAMPDVRELSVTTVSVLSDQAIQRRLEYIRQFRSVLLETLSMVLVMTLTSAAAWLLYRQVEARAASEHRMTENLRRIFDAKPVAILIVDPEFRIQWMNTPAIELFGVNGVQVKDQDAVELFFPGVRRKDRQGGTHPLTEQESSGSANTYRDIVQLADGSMLAAEVTRIRLITESGTENSALFVRDISRTQRALRALRRERGLAEAEATRYQRFLAVMSHEIRSPLHAIMAALDLARQKPEAAALADLHSIAIDAAQVALEEADAVLEIGRAEHEMRAAEPVIFSPSQIVRDLTEMARPTVQRSGTELSVEIGPGADTSVLGLRACFWHAAANLVSNAIKFTKGGTVRMKLTRSGADLRLEVIDSGPGIAPELQKLVFRDHYTQDPVPGRRSKGAGLGLGVFVAAVRTMSGDYGLQSQPGRGSTFWFTFTAPAEVRPALASPNDDSASALPVPTDLRVLVVDDSHVNRTLIQQMFANFGLNTDLASSGVEAVALAQAFAYDLILMDLSMPDMDGYTAAALIRQTGASRQASIIALTANVLARQEVEKPGSAFDDLLLKPLRLEGLRQTLTSDLRRSPVSEPALPPIVDQEIAGDLLEILPGSSIEPLLKALLDEALDLERDLDRAAQDESLSSRFHRVAGSAGMLGAARLRALAQECENLCKDVTQVPSPAFRETWRQTISETAQDWAALLALRAEPDAATIKR